MVVSATKVLRSYLVLCVSEDRRAGRRKERKKKRERKKKIKRDIDKKNIENDKSQ